MSNWFANVDVVTDISSRREFSAHFASLGRLILFDQAGTGASDPISLDAMPTLEQWTDTLTTVMDAAGSSEAVLVGFDSGFCTAAMFAATHPSRASALIGLGGYPRKAWAEDYPFGVPVDAWTAGVETTASIWGTGAFQRMINPDMPWSEEIRAEWARLERLAAPPSVF